VVELRIAGPDADGIGEIQARTPTSTGGYLGEEEPITDADGWIASGDLGRIDDEGWLYVTGRSKDVIIRGGENVSAARVETVLQEHPHVAEVAVLGLADPDLGEVVAAAVVPAAGSELAPDELERWARASLAHFAVPSRWWIRAEALPVNDTGKVVKSRLVQTWPAAS
jgi:long-chain acyl-CoA synthetase